jgi:preprotein translocase subunit SecF
MSRVKGVQIVQLIKPDTNINFVGMRFSAFIFSVVVICLGLIALVWRGGLNLGVDFAGGTLIQVQFQEPTDPGKIRDALKGLGISGSAVQQVGDEEDNEFLIRTELDVSKSENLSKEVETGLTKAYGEGKVTVRRVEMVGPKVGHDLRQKALFAIYYALLFIAIYISGRFEMKWAVSGMIVGILLVAVYLLQALGMSVTYLILGALILTLALCWIFKLPYALAAVLALIHDVLITVGAFALTNKEFTLEVIAAVLTIIGYSLNDTIIVFDRIRENLRKSRRQEFSQLINTSINQTLSRTFITSGTTLLVVTCLFILGGSVIHDFAFALLIGVIVGTYSSIFVASPLLILYEDWAKGRRRPVRAKAVSQAKG